MAQPQQYNPQYAQPYGQQYAGGPPPQQYGQPQQYASQPPPYGGQQYGQPQQAYPPQQYGQPTYAQADPAMDAAPPGYGQPQAQGYYGQPQPAATGPSYMTPQQQLAYNATAQQPAGENGPPVYAQGQGQPVQQQYVPPSQDGSGWKYGANEDGLKRMDYSESYYRDPLWAMLFLAHILGMGAGLIVQLGGLSASQASARNHGLLVIFVAAVLGAIIGYSWLKVMQYYADCVIKFMLIFTAVMWLALVIVMFAVSPLMGIIFGIFFLFYLLYIYMVRDRIPFATAMLNIASRITQTYPGTVWSALFGLSLQIVWVIWWVLVAGGILARGSNRFIWFMLLISLYWTLEVLKNVVHVTVCGVAATWYFSPAPENPTRNSLKRATTTSFGSICLGSLIVAVLQAIRASIRAARQSDYGSFLLCILECIVACIEDLMQYFNVYAYAQVAIYGKKYTEAAKDTWNLFLSRGFDAIINDDLTGLVVFAGGLIAGIFCAIVGGVMASRFDDLRSVAVLYGFMCFIVGLFLCIIVLNVVRSAIACVFVCYAEDPAALQRSRPPEYALLENAWRQAY